MNLDLYSGNYKHYLIVPAVLFILFVGLIFVFPGLDQGLDLRGGTLLVVKADKPVQKESLVKALNENFSLSGLMVSTTTGATGFGANIEFTENKVLADAEALLKSAKESGNRQQAEQALALVADYAVPESIPAENELFFKEADKTLEKAREGFNSALQSLIVKELGLSGEIAFQRKEIGPALGKSFWETASVVGITAAVLSFFSSASLFQALQ